MTAGPASVPTTPRGRVTPVAGETSPTSADPDDGQPQGARRGLGHDRVSWAPPARSGRTPHPSAGRGSASPLLGQKAIARSAWAVIVSDGFTPRLAEIGRAVDDVQARVAVDPLVGVDDAGLGRVADGAAADEVRGQRPVERLADVAARRCRR